MKKYILPVITAVLCCSAANAFELDDFVLSGVRVKGIPSSQPALDGRYYYQFNNEGTMIKRYSYKKEKDVTTFFDNAKIPDNSIKAWDGYTMSSDEKSILLWEGSRYIYRYSFTTRSIILAANPICPLGRQVTYSTSLPKVAKDMATLASLPPKLPNNSSPCVKRLWLRFEKRNNNSPKVTILPLMSF